MKGDGCLTQDRGEASSSVQADGNLCDPSTRVRGRKKGTNQGCDFVSHSALRLGLKNRPGWTCSRLSVTELCVGGYKVMPQVLMTIGDGMLGLEEKHLKARLCLVSRGGRERGCLL